VAYLLAAIGRALCLAQAAVLVRGVPPVHPVTMNAIGMNAIGMIVGAALLLAGSALTGNGVAPSAPPVRDPTPVVDRRCRGWADQAAVVPQAFRASTGCWSRGG
jgi:hypothetical protein